MVKLQRAFSIIELVVVIGLIALVTLLSIRMSGDVLSKSNLVSQLASIKGMINQSKGFAMMHGVPVLFDYSNEQLSALADFDMDGSFGDSSKEIVIGTLSGSDIDPVDLGFTGVNFKYTGTIDHWSGFQDSTANFAGNQFLISPLGHIRAVGGTHNPVSGAIFLTTKEGFLGAIYISPLGDLKTAIKEPTEANWSWND
jgi:Tfp pilus assembly major pilin PilA